MSFRPLRLRQVLVRHRRAREPLLVEPLPGAVLHGLAQALVQRFAERVVALLHDKSGRSVEGRNVDGNAKVLVTLSLLLGRFVVEEVGVNGSVVESRNGSVVVGELHEIRLSEILCRKDLLERALNDAEALAGQIGFRLDLRRRR